MLLSSRPFLDALFESPIFPKEEMKAFLRHAGPNIAFFHKNEGLMFFSPVLRRIWPKASFGASIDLFMRLIEGDVLPAEKSHLTSFWEKFMEGVPKIGDRFVLKTGQIQGAQTLGVVYFSIQSGHLMVLVPGEGPKMVSKNLDEIVRLNPWDLTDKLTEWVRDSEIESLVGHFLRSLPEEFLSSVSFVRKSPGDLSEIVYRFQKDRWIREFLSGPATIRPEEALSEVRHYGKFLDGNISLHFTVFVGGIFPLGSASFPAKTLEAAGLDRFNRFLHQTSTSLVLWGQRMVSKPLRFCRHWGGQGFEMDALSEIAALIDPERGKEMVILPFWIGDSDDWSHISLLDSVRYTTDILFVDQKNGLGAILLRNTDLEKARSVVREKFLQRLPVPFGDPVTLGEFMANR